MRKPAKLYVQKTLRMPPDLDREITRLSGKRKRTPGNKKPTTVSGIAVEGLKLLLTLERLREKKRLGKGKKS